MTSKKPVILLTPYFNTERDEPYMRPAFLKAVRHAGAVPVILPLDLEEEERAFVKHKAPVRQETPVPVSSAPVKEQIPEKAAPFKEEDQDDDFEFIDLDL